MTDVITHARDHGYRTVQPTDQAEDEWIDHVNSGIVGTMQETAESWAFGSNVPGRKRAFLLYAGGLPQYRERIREATDHGYAGFEFGA